MGTSRAYFHERTDHTGCTDTLRAPIPDFSHSPRLVPRRVLQRRRQASGKPISGFGHSFEGPHRPMGPPERSAQPRDQRHRPLSLSNPPDGCAPGALKRVEAAIAENSPKTPESAKTVSMANGQLTRAVPGRREPQNVTGGASPGRLRPPEGPDALGRARLNFPGGGRKKNPL